MKNNSLWFQVEQEIANLLIRKLEDQEITPEHAVEIAKFVVKSIPSEMSDLRMMEIIPILDDQFTELASIVYKHLKDYEDEHKTNVEEIVDKLVKDGKLEEASKLMQQYFQNKL